MTRIFLGFALALMIMNPKTTIYIVSKTVFTANDIVARFSFDTEKEPKN